MIARIAAGLMLTIVFLGLPQPTAACAPVPPTPLVFAPPLDDPMTYRVSVSRMGRDGQPIRVTQTYRLLWSSLGRGFRLDATLESIESTGTASVQRSLAGLLEPLKGRPTAYLIDPSGKDIVLVDAAELWAGIEADIDVMGRSEGQSEGKQLAKLLLALPPAERERLLSADIRGLHRFAGREIHRDKFVVPAAIPTSCETLELMEQVPPLAASPMVKVSTDTQWTIDRRSGLILREMQRESIAGDKGQPQIVGERLRELVK